jgi:2-(1,2-epoxy-1,2-dihydrophenyl)acetyl-CoA isomerase|tara:strand:- start:3906 stop:4760 length:855 start_codon:yes stop_codon:yes gene_type:complete
MYDIQSLSYMWHSDVENTMSEPDVLRELTDDGILLVTLNRPDKMNALNAGISEGIQSAVNETKLNDDIKVIVLTGNGRGFCAGADLSTGGPAGGGPKEPGRAAIVDKHGPAALVESLAASHVPLIGAINGAAAGAGFGISLCMDIRIASEQARMGTIFIKRGVGPDYGTSYWLPKLVGVPKAFEMIYSGELLTAEEALQVGLVNRVVPHDSLLEETMEYARMIASGPPLAYTYTRRSIVQSLHNNLDQQLVLEWTQQSELLRSKDAIEGFKAFTERRDPKFLGR